ncbi:MAG TPA: methyl-accepting chemotaxis protein [Gemmatimonadaceae bacterium]|nr:methyl-accepting chemotaxis protein [Gemmatimonadaceae bacterium]
MPSSPDSTPREFAPPTSAIPMRVVPLTALVAAIILVPLALLGDRQLDRSLNRQADSRLVTVARRYAALADVVVRVVPAAAGDASGAAAQRQALDGVFATGSVSEIDVSLVDSAGRTLAGAEGAPATILQPIARATSSGRDTVFTYDAAGGAERGAVASANAGRWRVLAHERMAQARAAYTQAHQGLVAAVVLLFAIVVGLAVAVDRLINRRIREPVARLAGVAEAVAGGDLTVRVPRIKSTDEIERLARALAGMNSELGRLASALTTSAHETATMSGEITASSEQMAAAAGEIAHTASHLSAQSGNMAEAIHTLAGSAASLVSLADQLDSGAHEGVERNARLRALALENRERLADGSQALEALTHDVQESATSISALVEASQEIRSFVTLVQQLARQSKMLALNAAMEAARAGDQGEGFAVVAAEVRRLSGMSSDAAERTQRVVAEILAGVETARENAERTMVTARDVRSATDAGSASFGQIEQVVAELDTWAGTIEQTASGAHALVRQMTERLDALARGTESFAAAMQQVAASSEEQSASTQEIAAAASSLSAAADRLARLVGNLRTDGPQSPRRSGSGPARASGAAAPVPLPA